MDIKGALKGLLNAAAMSKPIAVAEDDGVRSVVNESVATNITPQKLATILDDAAKGDPKDFFELAQEMEERDPHYGSVLATRKLALIGIEPEIEAASDDPKDIEIAKAVEDDILNHPELANLLSDCSDALGKGISIVEIMWNTSNPLRWTPERFEWIDPTWITFDKKSLKTPLLKSKTNKDGAPLNQYRYITHTPQIKSGLPIRGGLARLATWSWLLKSYTIKDWAAFCELFGQPLRLGKFGPNATAKDKRALLTAVRKIARDAAAIIPASMDMELIQTNSKGGDPVFAAFAEYLDGAISKAVLGQTMTSDNGSSQAQANVHNDVRLDLRKADARQLAVTINRDLIKPYCIVNFGELEKYPVFKIDVAEPEDLDLLSKVLERIVELGVTVSEREVRDKFGWSEPEEGDNIIGGITPSETQEAKNKIALNHEQHNHVETDEIDLLVKAALAGWRPQGDPLLEPIQQALNKATSIDEFAEQLPTLLTSQDVGTLTDSLAGASTVAKTIGAAGDENG